MTEAEYCKVANRVSISGALALLREVTPGEGFGLSKTELIEITKRLAVLQQRLFDDCNIEEKER